MAGKKSKPDLDEIVPPSISILNSRIAGEIERKDYDAALKLLNRQSYEINREREKNNRRKVMVKRLILEKK